MPHRRKRKAALALSAGVMGLSAGAMHQAPQSQPAFAMQMIGPEERKPAAEMQPSDALMEILVEEEGVRHTVYRDAAGNPTVGVGHLVAASDGLRIGQRVGQDRILDFLEEDLKEAKRAVMRLTGDLPLYQHEFDALVDLVYNVGEGNLSEDRSPRLNEAIAAADYDAIAEELGYHQASGVNARGLVYRSERRAAIWAEGEYEDPRPARHQLETRRA
ncbi:hypothetical protein WYH_00121 [Croceibacterium atlanticum]|uniref:Lysozyme n=2 Tax=Croceibacterium atlanticum TaxID=1267766 RepID=A0A0F7KPZ2_9SPHN|nr:hypothetical protein WYH_00121 [Croceibacterium atlanticum]